MIPSSKLVLSVSNFRLRATSGGSRFLRQQEPKSEMRKRRKLSSLMTQRRALITSLLILCFCRLMISCSPVPSNQVPETEETTTRSGQSNQLKVGHLRQVRSRRQLRSIGPIYTHNQRLFSPFPIPKQEIEQIKQIETPLALVSSSSSIGAQHPDGPKLIPLSSLDRYPEGADLRLFCSASAPQSGGRLQFEWRKNQNELLVDGGAGSGGGGSGRSSGRQLSVGMMDDSASVLRITHLEADDSGNYTCLARNQHGVDSSTVRISVNVRLKWIKEPPSEVQVKAGKSVQLECDASGQPAPLISWSSLKDHQTIHSKVLRLDRAQVNDSGLYECRASGHLGYSELSALSLRQQATGSSNVEQLRKVVKLTVNGK